MRKAKEEKKEKKEKKVFTPANQSKRVNTPTKQNNKADREESQEEKLNLYKISEIRQDQYVQIPKELFYNERYSDLSSDAKLLYGLLLDRMELSRVNNWINQDGEIYLIFTREEIQEILKISKKTCVKAFKQLAEKKLILEKRQGLNKPNLIFIGHIEYKSAPKPDKNRRCKNYTSGGVNFTPLEVENLHPNKTDLNKTNLNKNENLILSSQTSKEKEPEQKTDRTGQDKTGQDRTENTTTLEAYEKIIKENMEYDSLCKEHPHDKKFIDDIIFMMLDVILSNSKTIQIAGEPKNSELVKSVFLKLNYYQVEHVIQKYQKVTSKIKKIKQYLLTMLFNARLECEASVINEVATEEPFIPDSMQMEAVKKMGLDEYFKP